MISVIITTHNRKEMLQKAIQSVMAQSFTDWELVIVDDGSSDGTKEYIASITDERIRYVRRSKAFGCDTRPKNRGVKESHGEYIAFLDDDNQYRPDHLQVLYKAMERDPSLDVAYGDRMIIYPDGSTAIGVRSNFAAGALMLRNFIDTSDVLIRREAIYAVGGWDERYTKYVDWNLWVRMAKAGKKFQRVPYIITDYYLHGDQKSAKVHTKNDDEQRGIFKPEWDWLDLEIDLPYLHTPKDIRIAVFSLTKDRLEYTKTCFKSLQDKAGYPFTHFVVDNDSTDGTVTWLWTHYQSSPKQQVYLNKSNEGISRGSNRALSHIMEDDYDLIVKYDNDCLSVSEGWLREIVELYKRNHMMCFSPYPEGLKDSPGGAPRINHWKMNGHFVGLTEHLGGLCHVAPASVYKAFRWREDSVLHGLQDLELSKWLNDNNYLMGYVEDLRVQHYEGTEGQHKRYPEYFELRKLEKVTKPK